VKEFVSAWGKFADFRKIFVFVSMALLEKVPFLIWLQPSQSTFDMMVAYGLPEGEHRAMPTKRALSKSWIYRLLYGEEMEQHAFSSSKSELKKTSVSMKSDSNRYFEDLRAISATLNSIYEDDSESQIAAALGVSCQELAELREDWDDAKFGASVPLMGLMAFSGELKTHPITEATSSTDLTDFRTKAAKHYPRMKPLCGHGDPKMREKLFQVGRYRYGLIEGVNNIHNIVSEKRNSSTFPSA
jgi:hypothetical protein